MGKIEYEKCTLEELLDVEKHIDKEKYPERFLEVQQRISERNQGIGPKEETKICSSCGTQLERAKISRGKWEWGGIFFLWLIPIVEFFAWFLASSSPDGYVCPNCEKEYRESDVRT